MGIFTWSRMVLTKNSTPHTQKKNNNNIFERSIRFFSFKVNPIVNSCNNKVFIQGLGYFFFARNLLLCIKVVQKDENVLKTIIIVQGQTWTCVSYSHENVHILFQKIFPLLCINSQLMTIEQIVLRVTFERVIFQSMSSAVSHTCRSLRYIICVCVDR